MCDDTLRSLMIGVAGFALAVAWIITTMIKRWPPSCPHRWEPHGQPYKWTYADGGSSYTQPVRCATCGKFSWFRLSPD